MRSEPTATLVALFWVVLGCVHSTTGRFEEAIAEFEASDRRNPPPERAVLLVGSSSIALWATLQQDFPSVPTIRRGFGGSEIEDVLHYVDRIVIPYRPRIVVLYVGDNDLASGKTPDRVFSDLSQLVTVLHRELPNTRIAFISIKPSLARWHLIASIRAVNELVKARAAKDRRLAYIDVFTPMLGPDGSPRRELFVEDGLHLSPEGYALWRRIVAPFLR